jgi:hypothetical protein
MKLSELKKLIELYDLNPYHENGEVVEVVIQIKLPYFTVGGIPFVKVKTAYPGFDWDQGKFFIIPEEDVTPSDRDFAKQMKEMQDRAGWADYENRNLKAEIKQLKKKYEVE